MQYSSPHTFSTIHLVLTSRLLARLKLIQVPPTNRQASLVVIHALPEIAHVRLADLRGLVVRVHNGTLFSLSHGLVGRRCCCLGGAAAEETADCVADGGAYCHTAVYRCQSLLRVDPDGLGIC